eukprot:c41443_g1_i1 orf=32-211(+)
MVHTMLVTIGELTVSSHPLDIETWGAVGVSREARLCRLCHTEVKFGEHYVCTCPIYYEI